MPNPDPATLAYRGRSALITGASSGIGASFARALAARGADLVLTARRLDRLQALADELTARHTVSVHCLAADLADAAAPATLVEQIAALGIDIDVLVNNAGYGVPGAFHKSDWATHAAFLRVLLHAPTELAHRLLGGMQARGYGRIVNVASLAGLVPGSAGNTLYGASKAYLISFSQSLALENGHHGVRVQALCPGFTWSEFHDVSGARQLMNRLPRFMFQTADEVVRESLSALERGPIVRVTGTVNRLIAALVKLMPARLALALTARQSKRFRIANK